MGFGLKVVVITAIVIVAVKWWSRAKVATSKESKELKEKGGRRRPGSPVRWYLLYSDISPIAPLKPPLCQCTPACGLSEAQATL